MPCLYTFVSQVLVDTEAEGHRVAFNEAFKRKGRLPLPISAGAALSGSRHLTPCRWWGQAGASGMLARAAWEQMCPRHALGSL